MTDILVTHHGTVVTFTPLTEAARTFLATAVQWEPWQWLGKTLCVEFRFAVSLAQACQKAKLTLEVTPDA